MFVASNSEDCASVGPKQDKTTATAFQRAPESAPSMPRPLRDDSIPRLEEHSKGYSEGCSEGYFKSTPGGPAATAIHEEHAHGTQARAPSRYLQLLNPSTSPKFRNVVPTPSQASKSSREHVFEYGMYKRPGRRREHDLASP